MLTLDEQADLKWFFSEARGDCGVRSVLGFHLDMVQQGTMRGKNERRVHPDIQDHVALAGRRANDISRRLERCHPVARLSLELHYGAEVKLGDAGVSVALACATPAARAGYKAALKTAKAREGKNNARWRALATIRMWLLWVSTRAQQKDGESAEALLEKILGEAREALHGAQLEYEATR